MQALLDAIAQFEMPTDASRIFHGRGGRYPGCDNSGLMELHQAIGVIMGANIGTTVTGWLLSLSGLEGDSFAIQMLNPNAWARSWWAFPS